MVTSDNLNVEKKSGAANFVERAQVQGPECRGCKYALIERIRHHGWLWLRTSVA
jgi:hypothetical protein